MNTHSESNATAIKDAWTAYFAAMKRGDVPEMTRVYDERIAPLEFARTKRATTRRMLAPALPK